MARTPIYARSPRMINISGTTGDSTYIDIFLWNDPDSIPANATYTLSRDLVTTDVYYDISPYCREYISHQSFTEISSGEQAATVTEYCYCTVKSYKNDVLTATTELTAFDGYGFHADGYNPTVNPVMLDEGEYYVKEDENSGAVFVYDDGVSTWTATYTGITTGGTTNQNITNTFGYIPMLLNTYASEGNTLEIKKNAVVQKTFTITTVCEDKYTPVDVDFVNRYGAWQRVVFFKAKKENLETRTDTYTMHPESVNYNTSDNIKQTFNTNGSEKYVCNTGWVPEAYSDVIKQLMLSEKVLLDGLPVQVDTKSIEKFTHLNNNNINYEVSFSESNDTINYVI